MSLKYNSRESLESKLSILKCCIGSKAIDVSNAIALALGDVDCKIQELEILQQYYDTLQCYYPFDCWTQTNCTEEKSLELQGYTINTSNSLTLASWVLAGNTITIRMYNILTNQVVNVNWPYNSFDKMLEVLQFFANYIRPISSTFGYTVVSYRLDPPGVPPFTYSYALQVEDCNIVNSLWGFDLYNETIDALLQLRQLTQGTSTCACEETCCNIKLIPEILGYTLVTPQSLETKTITLTNDQCLDIGSAEIAGDVLNFKIYNLLSGSLIVLPYIYTAPSPSASAVFNAGKLALEYIRDYININTQVLGYTCAVTSVFVSSSNCSNTIVLTMNNCTQDIGTNLWGFIVYDVTTDQNLETTRLKGYTPIGSTTCPIYSTQVIRPESIECIENCITDIEAEKIVRHALSLCECCLDIEINNEPFN